MNNVLMNAILAMDSYNRGYNPGIKFGQDQNFSEAIPNVTQIGNATVLQATRNDDVSAQATSFYAIAYQYNGQNIISFRGTDQLNADRLNGYDVGLGMPDAPQAGMAFEFYRSIASQIGASSLQTANISLTGHSLGGGLAGLLASVYHRPATLFDNMAFETAALRIPDYITDSGITDLYYNPNLQNAIWGSNPITTPSISTNGSVAAYHTSGELLNINRPLQNTPSTSVSIGENVNLGVFDFMEKHNMATLAMLMYARTTGIPQNWTKAASNMWPVLYNDAFASQIGVNSTRLNGQDITDGKFSSVLKQIFAYSAIDEGERLFGDTGIRALFDDANDIGSLSTANSGARWLLNQGMGSVTQAYVQFAGQLALERVLMETKPFATKGILTANSSTSLLSIDFSDRTWSQISATPPPILAKQTIIDTILRNDIVTTFPQVTAAMTAVWGNSSYNIFDHVGYVLADNRYADFSYITPTAGKSVLITGGAGADTFIGTNGNDLFLGWGGVDTVEYYGQDSAIIFSATSTYSVVTDDLGNKDILHGIERVFGSNFNDQFRGVGGKNETFYGNSGNDRFYAYASGSSIDADIFYGNSGFDTADFSNIAQAITASAGTAKLGGSPTTILNSIENIILTNYNDTFTANYGGESKVIYVDGGSGIDLFSGAIFYDRVNDLYTDNFGRVAYKLTNFETVNVPLDLTPYDSGAVVSFNHSPGLNGGDTITVGGFVHNINLPTQSHNSLMVINGTHHGDIFENYINIRDLTSNAARENAAFAYVLGLGNDVVNLAGGADDTIFVYTGGHDVFQSAPDANAISSIVDTIVLKNVRAADVTYTVDRVYSNSPSQNHLVIDLTLHIAGKGSIKLDHYAYSPASGLAYNDSLDRVYTEDGHLRFNISQGVFAGLTYGSLTHLHMSSFSIVRNGNDSISGTQQNDILQAMIGNDSIDGLAGNDTIYAGTGNDNLYGGAGSDTLYGGAGADFYVINREAVQDKDYIEEPIETAIDTISFGSGISANSIYMWGYGNSYFVSYDGINTNLEIYAEGQETDLASRVERITFSGGPTWNLASGLTLNDTDVGHSIGGSAAADTINGRGGNDQIYGQGGNDTLEGGAGNDNIYGGTGNDIIIHRGKQSVGYDIYTGEAGTDTLRIYLTSAEFSALTRDALYGLYNIIQSSAPLQNYNINTLNITVSSIEALAVYVDNILYDFSVPPVVTGTSGNDSLSGTSGNDTINGGAGNDSISGLDGNDVLDGGAGTDTLNGGAGNDAYNISQNSGLDTITDTSGADKIVLGAGIIQANTSYVRSGNDLTLSVSGAQIARIVGHYAGTDTVETLQFSDGTTVNLTTLNLPINGTTGNDTLNGTTGNDIINGLAGNDTLNGNGGNDIFDGGTGTDVINGGAGNDTYNIASGNGLDTITDTAGTDKIVFGTGLTRANMALSRDTTNINDLAISFSGTRVALVKNFFTGTNQVETLQFSDGSTYNLPTHNFLLSGTAAADTLTGYSGVDTIRGAAGNDILYGGGGNDTLFGKAGNDTLRGEAGNDIYVYDGGLDRIYETGGADTLQLGAGMTVDALVFSDIGTVDTKMVFSTGINEVTLYGHRGTDANLKVETVTFLDGFSANLTTYKTWVWGTTAAQTTNGTTGVDTILGRGGNDTINGNAGNDALHGGAGNDTLRGGDGNDLVHGGIGNDMLYGDSGNDVLYGDDGLDNLYGGAGADTFKFLKETAFKNIDVIQDFSRTQTDKIDIAGLLQGYDPLTKAITDFVQITTSGADSILRVDSDGGANSFIQIATIKGVTGLTDEAALVASGHLAV